MNSKGLLTAEQAPWLEYLIIDKNGKRRIKATAPIEIKNAYNEYRKKQKDNIKSNTPIAK